MTASPKPHRWYQFSLRTMFAITTLTVGLAVLFAQPVIDEFVMATPVMNKADGIAINEVNFEGYHRLSLRRPLVFCLEMLALAGWWCWRRRSRPGN